MNKLYRELSEGVYPADDALMILVTRDPQAEADAELGRMVRRLPHGWSVIHMIVPEGETYDDWTVTDETDKARGDARTLEAALREALGEGETCLPKSK